MKISDIQQQAEQLRQIQDWQDRTPDNRFRYLITEIGELSEELIRLHHHPEDAEQIKVDMAKEMYDIVWNLCDLANVLEIDLEPHFEEKYQTNLKRTWKPKN